MKLFMTYGEILRSQFNKLKTKDYEDYGVILVKNRIFQIKREIGISVTIFYLFICYYLYICTLINDVVSNKKEAFQADPSGYTVWDVGLWPLVAGIASSNSAVGMDVCLLCVLCVDR